MLKLEVGRICEQNIILLKNFNKVYDKSSIAI